MTLFTINQQGKGDLQVVHVCLERKHAFFGGRGGSILFSNNYDNHQEKYLLFTVMYNM